MTETASDQSCRDILEWALADLEAGRTEELHEALVEAHPAEVADLLESLPPDERRTLWETVPSDLEGDILAYMHDEARATIIDEMDHTELVAAAESMDVEDLAEVLIELPEDLTEKLMIALDHDYRQRLEAVLSYDEGTAGRLMSTDVASVRKDVSLAVVLRWLRRHQTLPPHTDSLMVISEEGLYLGKLPMEAIVTGDPTSLVESVMLVEAVSVPAGMQEREVAALFERRDLISVAVLDEQDHLLGRITVDDVVDVILEKADHAILKSAGLDKEEDLFSPVVPSAQRRGIWLGINLITVFLAAWVIGRFEEALDKIVALAVLMPVVASMGGIAGSQTLTLTIRGLALDQIAKSNVRWLIAKELLVGTLNGLIWAVIVAVVAFLWFGSIGIASILGVAMVLNLLAAALMGVMIPLVLQKLSIDPALSGAVILTTVTDIIGFLSFLGLASIFLL
ncbi:MAG: magnesium transporter [Candidatus Thiodiazotropha sp.]